MRYYKMLVGTVIMGTLVSGCGCEGLLGVGVPNENGQKLIESLVKGESANYKIKFDDYPTESLEVRFSNSHMRLISFGQVLSESPAKKRSDFDTDCIGHTTENVEEFYLCYALNDHDLKVKGLDNKERNDLRIKKGEMFTRHRTIGEGAVVVGRPERLD